MVKTNYKNHAIEIYKTFNGTEVYVSNPAGEQIYGHKVQGSALARAKEVIDRIAPDEVCFWCLDTQVETETGAKVSCAFCGKGETESQAEANFRREFAATLLMDESDGARMQKALCKAMDELAAGIEYTFDNGVLKFVSRNSRKTYIVTRDNCSTNCPAANENHFCYHRAMHKLLDSNVREFSFLRVIDTDDERSFGFPVAA